jgi:hypothetical protein
LQQTRYRLDLSASRARLLQADRELASVSVRTCAGTISEQRAEAARLCARRANVPRGTNVVVAYFSNDEQSTVTQFELSAADALTAARVALEAQSDGAQRRLLGVRRLAAESEKSCWILGVECDEASAEDAARCARGAGLTPLAVIPSRAYAQACVASVVRRHTGEDSVVVLRLDETAGALAGGVGGELALVRPVDIGHDALAQGYRSALRAVLGDDADADELHARAELLLWKHGVPGRDVVVDQALGLTGSMILPALQPVIQRISVELRQTIKFGLGDSAMSNSRVVLSGDIANLTGFADAVSLMIEMPVNAAPVDSDRCDEIFGVIEPSTERARTTVRRFARGTACGAAAALAGAALIANGAMEEAAAARADDAALTPQLLQLSELHDRITLVSTDITRVNSVKDALDAALGVNPRWSLVMGELSRLTPGDVKISRFSGSSDSADARLRIDGSAPVGDGNVDPLVGYLERLRGGSLFSDVQIASSRLESRDGAPRREFSLTLRVRAGTFSAMLLEER